MGTSAIPSLHIVAGQATGGAELFFVRLVNTLYAQGHTVETVNNPDSRIADALDPRVPCHRVAMRSVWDLPSRWKINRIIQQLQFPIVQTYMGRATRLTHLGKPGSRWHVARLGGYYDLKGYRHAHAWVGNTRGICDYLRQHGLPAERVCYISNFASPAPRLAPAELHALRAQYAIPVDAWCLVGVGRLHPVKGYSDLLHALAQLPEQINGRVLHLVIAGDGPLAGALHQQARQLGLQQRVHWAGWQRDPSAYYQLADLFICPSRYEPLGNVVLEAWAQGCSVLSTASAGPSEIGQHGETLWLTPIEQPTELAHGIRRLLEDADLRQHLAIQGQQQVSQHYSPEVIVGQYLQMYRNLLEHGRVA